MLYPRPAGARARGGRSARSASRRLRHRRPPARRPRAAGLAEPPRGRRRGPRPRRRRRAVPALPPAGGRTPDGGVVVHLHGGGFVFHDLDVHDASARRLANRTGLAVLSVDYRRPPEHRFPAAPDDVDTVLGWLAARAPRDWASTGPTLRPRRQRRRQPRAGRGAAPPRAVPRGRADLPVPRPDGRLRVLPHGAPTASTRARRPGTGSSTPPRRPTSSDPDLAPLLSDRLGTPAADAGRHRRARPAARRGRAPRPAARRGRRRGRRRPATSGRCTASGATPRVPRRRAADAPGRRVPAPAAAG